MLLPSHLRSKYRTTPIIEQHVHIHAEKVGSLGNQQKETGLQDRTGTDGGISTLSRDDWYRWMEGCLTTKEVEGCKGATTNNQELDDSGCLEEDVQESGTERIALFEEPLRHMRRGRWVLDR